MMYLIRNSVGVGFAILSGLLLASAGCGAQGGGGGGGGAGLAEGETTNEEPDQGVTEGEGQREVDSADGLGTANDQPTDEVDSAGDEPDALTQTMLYVISSGLQGYRDAGTLRGPTITATTDLDSDPAGDPVDAAFDARGALYVISSLNTGTIAVYDNPLTATGNRTPDRMVSGDLTGLFIPTGLAIDVENDLLYVSNGFSNSVSHVVVFDLGTPDAFDGNVEPISTFDVDMDSVLFADQVQFANGSLYVVDAPEILVFDSPADLKGPAIPDRVITNAAFDDNIQIHLADADRMIVASGDTGGTDQVFILERASTLDGAVEPDVVLTVARTTGTADTIFAAIDSQDRLFIADGWNGVIYTFDNASTLTSGEYFADRDFDLGTYLPDRLLLSEEP